MSVPQMQYKTTRYRHENAFWMAKLALLAYDKNDDGTPDTSAVLDQLKALDPAFEAVHGYDSKSSEAILVKH